MIDEAPADLERLLVYADWLIAHGNPWGELIAVQIAHERQGGAALVERAKELVPKTSFQSKVAWWPFQREVSARWRRGFVDTLTFGLSPSASIERLNSHHHELFYEPEAMLLRRLETRWVGEWMRQGETIAELVRSAARASRHLTSVDIGCFGDEAPPDNAHHRIGDVGYIEGLPRLTEVRIWGHQITLERPIDLPLLERLTLETCALPQSTARSIAASSWPRLEHLELWLGWPGYGGMTEVADLAPILDGDRFPKLVRLGLPNADIADEIAEAIVASPILERLRELDLSQGTLSDRGAAVLVEHADRWRHLERLDVGESQLGQEAIASLADVGPAIDAERQKTSRYVSMWE
jgi:uncharacterized protein (TIGR02996 family)